MFIGLVYILRNGGVTISTAISALQLKAGTNGPIEILRSSGSQANSVTSAQASAALVRKTAAATVTAASAGTTLVKANPVLPTADASLGTSATGITATAEGTDGEIPYEDGLNALTGDVFVPIPEERLYVPQAGIIALKFLDAPPSAKWYCSIRFRELRAG
jgi:hypothetical protein